MVTEINLDDLTIGQLKEIWMMFGPLADPDVSVTPEADPAPLGLESPMIGKYVIVRCRDAGVHAGVLQAAQGRQAVLTESRRLWYWKSRKGSFLSGVARDGLDPASKIGGPIDIHLTETCEIIAVSPEAEKTIRELPTHERT